LESDFTDEGGVGDWPEEAVGRATSTPAAASVARMVRGEQDVMVRSKVVG
jgi:hypothetical protein